MSDNDQTLLDEIAEALRDAAIAGAVAEVAQQQISLERIEAVFVAAQAEADRSAAIVVFALAEDLMLDALKTNLNPLVAGGWNALTSNNGLLSSASNRLSLIELLWWVGPMTIADLRLLKSIRNHFAHHADVVGFTDNRVRGWITSMSPSERPIVEKLKSNGRQLTKLSLRDLYLIRSFLTVAGLARDLAIGPIAMKHRISPSDIGAKGFDHQPDNIKDAMRFTARSAIKLLSISS